MVFFSTSSSRNKKRRNFDYRHIRRNAILFACFIVFLTLFMSGIFTTPESCKITGNSPCTYVLTTPSLNSGTQYDPTLITRLDNGSNGGGGGAVDPLDPQGSGTELTVMEYLARDDRDTDVNIRTPNTGSETFNETDYTAPLLPDGITRKNLAYFNLTVDRIASATEYTEYIEDGYTNNTHGPGIYAQEFIVTSNEDHYYLTEVQLRAIGGTTAAGGSCQIEIRNSTDSGAPSEDPADIFYTSGPISVPFGLQEHFPIDLSDEKILLNSTHSYFVVVDVGANTEFYSTDDTYGDYGASFVYTGSWFGPGIVDFSVEHVKYRDAFSADVQNGGGNSDLNMRVTVYGDEDWGTYYLESLGFPELDGGMGGHFNHTFSSLVAPETDGNFYFDFDVDDVPGGWDLLIDANITMVYFWDNSEVTDIPTYSVLNGTDVDWTVTYTPTDPTDDPTEIHNTQVGLYEYYFVIDPIPTDWTATHVYNASFYDHYSSCDIRNAFVNVTLDAIAYSGGDAEQEWTVTFTAQNYLDTVTVNLLAPPWGIYNTTDTLDIRATLTTTYSTGLADMNLTHPFDASNLHYDYDVTPTAGNIDFSDHVLEYDIDDGEYTIHVLWQGDQGALSENKVGYRSYKLTIDGWSSGNGGNGGGGDGGGGDGGGGNGGGDGDGTSTKKTFTVTLSINTENVELESGTTGTITVNVTGSGFVSNVSVSLLIGDKNFTAEETNNSYVINYDLIDHAPGNYTAKLTVEKTGFSPYTKLFDVLVSPMTAITAMRVYAVRTTVFVQENWLLSTTWFILAIALLSIVLIVYVRPLNSDYLFDLYIFDRNNMAIYKQNFTPIETLLDPELPKEGIDARKAKEELKEQAITGITGLLKELTTEETQNIDLKTLRISMDGKNAKVAVWTKQASSILRPFVNYKIDRLLRKLRHKFEEYYYVDLKLSKPGVSEYLNIPSVFLESFKLTASPELYNLYIEYAEYLEAIECPVLAADAYYKALRICVKEQMKFEIDSCYFRLLKSLGYIRGLLGILRWIPFLSPTPVFTPHSFFKLHVLFKTTSLFWNIRKRKETKYIRSRWIAENSRRAATDLIQPEVVASVKSKNYSKALKYMDQAISLLEYAQKVYTQIKLSKEAEAVSSVLSTFSNKRNELFEMSRGFDNTGGI